MSNYDKTTFFYLQLHEDFFDTDTIKWLETQPNGKEYVLIYLKLCLKSLKSNGLIVQQVGKVLIPYDVEQIAKMVNSNVDTCRVCLGLFETLGLINVLDKGFLLTEIENLIGQKSKGAFKKQLQIAKRNAGNNVEMLEGGKKGGKFSTKDIDKVIVKDKVITKTYACACARELETKNETCRTCWNFKKCNRPYDNEVVNQALEKKPKEIESESVDNLKKFFMENS